MKSDLTNSTLFRAKDIEKALTAIEKTIQTLSK